MSEGPTGWQRESPPPPQALDDLWYIESGAKVLGPCDGPTVKAMIAAGSLGPATLIARVGASEWSPLRVIPAFAPYLLARTGQPGPCRYAGFWIRCLAYLIDSVFFLLMAFAAAFIALIVFVLASGMDIDSVLEALDADDLQLTATLQVIYSLATLAVLLFYYVYFPSGSWQATPGKRICGIYIVRVDGSRMTAGLALGRFLSYSISQLPLFLGFIMVAWSDQRKALHDMICGTRVVYGRL